MDAQNYIRKHFFIVRMFGRGNVGIFVCYAKLSYARPCHVMLLHWVCCNCRLCFAMELRQYNKSAPRSVHRLRLFSFVTALG